DGATSNVGLSAAAWLGASLGTPNGQATTWNYSFDTTTLPPDGTYALFVRATDALGHMTNSKQYTKAQFTIDRAPTPIIDPTSEPPSLTDVNTASFRFTEPSWPTAVNFQCSLDGSIFGGCSSPK